MTDDSESIDDRLIHGSACRTASALFNYGNIAAVLVPIPLGFLWIVASIIVYAMNRHHPDPKVGQYTQQAGFRFYGITGGFVIVASAFPGHALSYYLIAWAIAAAILIPLSIRDLYRIKRDAWPDVVIAADADGAASH